MIHDLLVVAAIVAAALLLISALLSREQTIRVAKINYVLACLVLIVVIFRWTTPTTVEVRYGPPAPQRFTCSNRHVPIVWLDGHVRNVDCSWPIVPARGVRP